MTEVDAEQRGRGAVGQLGGAQDGAVAADDDGELALLGAGVVAASPSRRRDPAGRSSSLASSSSIRTTSPWPSSADDHRPRDVARLLAARVGQQQDAPLGVGSAVRSRVHLLTRHPQVGGTGHLGLDRVPADLRLAARAATGRTPRCPTGPGSGLVVTARAPQPRRAAGVGDRHHGVGAVAEVADHAPLARAGPCRPRTAA